MKIKVDDLTGVKIAQFLNNHVEEMKSISPPESEHALDLEGLRTPDITFWAGWENNTLVGCGALKELDTSHGEIKSMRVAAEMRGKGYASQLLRYILDEAMARGYDKVSLETGSMDFFIPARKLYTSFGFVNSEPFATYELDPNSVFMSLSLKKDDK